MSKGLPYALLAYLAWGFLPLYWKSLDEIPAWEILGHRVLWSAIFLTILIVASKQAAAWKNAVRDWRTFRMMLICSSMISINWLVFIWAVNNGQMVQSSLGYYINPLLNVILGVVFLKERLNAGQWTAIGLAICGVAVVTVEFGQLPWVSLALALTFALYGLFKKKTNMDSIISLTWETLLVTPLAAGYLLFLQVGGGTETGQLSAIGWMLLLLAGAVTVLPLYWFAQAAKHLPLSTLGFIQYIGPTITLAIGVLVYHETFDMTRWISFGLIWSALAVYSVSSYRLAVRARRTAKSRAA